MTTEQDIEKIKENKKPELKDTIIPGFQNPDACVFCTDKNYDSIFYDIFRISYNNNTGKDIQRQDKETCMHHTDDWLKYSLYTAGFMWSAFTDHGNKSTTCGEIEELFKNKEEREKILTKEYDETKNYSCAIDLYLPKSSNTNTKNRYNNAFTIEDDIPIQNKIIHDKVKTYYTNAIEALRTLDDEETQ